MAERNAEMPEEKRIVYRIGVNLGDVLVEGDDILGDGVNIAARLEGICEPGGFCLSGTAYDHVRGKIDANFVDLGEKDLKNIARPMRVYAIQPGSEGAAPAASALRTELRGPAAPLDGRLAIRQYRRRSGAGAFRRRGHGEPHDRSFAHSGCRRDRPQYGVRLQGQAPRLKSIGRELNVRYVLEGSVQRGGNRMRVNVQLIDAETGSHLWAERFDKPLADLFDMQDEIVARLAGALNAQLVAAEARRAEQAPNPDSMDLYFQGMAWINKGLTLDNMAQARSFFDRALTANPDNVDALVGSARADVSTAQIPS